MQELDETRYKRQIEITEMNTQLEGQYQSKLQDSLQQIRQQLSIQLEMNRREIEEFYERKIKTANDACDRATLARAGDRDRLKQISVQIEKMEKERKIQSNLVIPLSAM